MSLMQNHRVMMKETLAESLRILMDRYLFEKITIKQICNEAGVIRATFYNYFDDKYDCLNSIVYHDIVERCKPYIDRNSMAEATTGVLQTIEENRSFYKTAYGVTGQNSFEDMIRDNLKILLFDYLNRYRKKGYLDEYDNDLLAGYFAECIAFHIRLFVFEKGGRRTVEQTRNMINDLMKNSFYDFAGEHS